MASPVHFLGGAQTDFARSIAKEGKDLGHFVREATLGAVGDAQIELSEIDSVHVGNAFGELFTGQAQLGAMPATLFEELDGVPAARHEGACASGSLAILAAAAEIEAGRAECVLVVGAEEERNVPGELAAKHLGAAAWVGHEAQGARFVWPHLFSEITDALHERYARGPTHQHLAAVAKKNFANAKRNPFAQTRRWSFGEEAFDENDAANPVVSGRVRRQDCGQVTDGAVAIVLSSAAFFERHARRAGRGQSAAPVLRGWGHRTSALSLAEKLRRGRASALLLPHLKGAADDAYRRARIAGPFDLSGIETHDCFTVTEYLAIDHLGITPPGEAYRAIEAGTCAMGGRLPINPSGGLIGGGHPVGATGVRMTLDACRQLQGRAGDMQVEGATRLGTLNIGGSATTAVCLVWETA